MKKRLLALFCVLALLVSGSAMVASADSTTLTYECPHCKKPVDWEPIVFGSHFATSGTDTATNHYHGEATHLHYYLDKDYTASQVKQMNIDAGITVCMDLLYSDIIANTQKHLVDTSAFLGENYYEFIIPSGTAVQYALRSLDTVRTQSEIYRDYTHMSDYGRLIAAYLWYAKIMGLSKIDNVGINAIPSVLHHSKSTFPTTESGYAVDDQMKLDIIECVNWALEHPFELPAE